MTDSSYNSPSIKELFRELCIAFIVTAVMTLESSIEVEPSTVLIIAIIAFGLLVLLDCEE